MYAQASVPKYVRRISDTEFEYGRIVIDDGSDRKHKYEKRGVKKSLEEAMIASGMETGHEESKQPGRKARAALAGLEAPAVHGVREDEGSE